MARQRALKHLLKVARDNGIEVRRSPLDGSLRVRGAARYGPLSDTWTILLDWDPGHARDVIPTLAHELGHALPQQFRYPSMRYYIDQAGRWGANGVTPEVVLIELQAWRIGQRLLKQCDYPYMGEVAAFMRKCLNTYTQPLGIEI